MEPSRHPSTIFYFVLTCVLCVYIHFGVMKISKTHCVPDMACTTLLYVASHHFISEVFFIILSIQISKLQIISLYSLIPWNEAPQTSTVDGAFENQGFQLPICHQHLFQRFTTLLEATAILPLQPQQMVLPISWKK